LTDITVTHAAPGQPTLMTRIAYGIGGAAEGVKNNGFDYFLLLYYSQVLGVPSSMVAAALFIALVFDAISDPVVGYWSDSIRTKLGRRHPFMYASIIPVVIIYYLTWSPPSALQGEALFPWLVAMTIGLRLGFTLFEVPNHALAAELTQDYDGRTVLVSFRTFFGWVGGLTMQIALFALFLTPTATDRAGFTDLDGWHTYGTVAAIVIGLAMLVCTLGTHRRIAHLVQPAALTHKPRLGRIFAEIWETVFNPSFGALFAATLFGLIATGISASLNQYVNGFFWQFSGEQLAVLTTSVYVSTVLALVLAPIIGKVLGKKRGSLIVGFIAFTVAPAPVVLSLLGFLPERGTPELFNIILGVTVIDVALIIVTQMLLGAMVADLAEDSEVKTGRRSEGVFFAGISFIRKLAQGSGVLLAAVILSVAAIQPGTAPGTVPEESLRALGWYYSLTLFGAWMLMMGCVSLYRISRESHQANLDTLARKRADSAGTGAL
jgi:glycoside/pentoside/hexuronide:cation symporter, GPH family